MNPNSFQAFFAKFRTDFTAAYGEQPAIAIEDKEMLRSIDKAAARTPIAEIDRRTDGRRTCQGGYRAAPLTPDRTARARHLVRTTRGARCFT